MAVFDNITGISVASGFKLQAKFPLDGRLVVNTITDRDALITENGAYQGMVVYVIEDETLYKLDGETASDWSAIGGDIAAEVGALEERLDTVEGKLETIEEGAEVNVLESITVNGEPVSLTSKTAALTIPEDAADVGAIPTSEKGANNGVAELDSTGKVPSSQLPSYVDDVETYENLAAFPQTGEDGKIYIAADTNLTYRWSGSAYIEISPSLALGETSSTAYRGDRGKIAYDHSQITNGNPHGTDLADLGVTLTATQINELPAQIEGVSDSLADVATSGDYNDLTNTPATVIMQTGTISTSETSKAVTVSGAAIFSCMVYDSVTNEQVLTNVVYNAARTQVTVSVSAAPTNTLNIVVAALTTA